MASGDETSSRDGPHGQSCYVPARYVFAAVVTLGTFMNVMLLASLPISMTAMVRRNMSSATSDADPDTCPGGPVAQHSANSSTVVGGEFDWDEVTQNSILTASTYGVLATTLLGGRLAEVWSPKYITSTCYALSAIIYLLFPVTTQWGVPAIVGFQVIAGLLSGPLQPVMMTMCAAWFPPQERQLLGAITVSAINLGTIASGLLTGTLVSIMGWRFVFYLFSSLVTVCILLWIFLVYDSPNNHPRISEEERIYIAESTKKDECQSEARLPWKEILLSLPVWAHVAMCLPGSWLGATLSNALPSYMKNILHYDTTKIGIISAIPPVAGWISIIFSGFASQWIRRKGYMSHLTTYHVFNGIATLLPAALLICVTFVGCNDVATIALLTLVGVLSSAYIGGSQLNQLDLAVNYTGTIVGLTATVQSIVQVVAPMITGVLTNNKQTLTAWKTVFFIAAAMKIVPFFIYLFFGTVDEQPWNRIQLEETTNKPTEVDHEERSQTHF